MQHCLIGAILLLAVSAAHAATIDETFSNPPATGLLVVRVLPEGQAAKLGLQPGDIITAYAGEHPRTTAEFLAVVKKATKGPIALELTRDGKSQALQAEPGRLGAQLIGLEKGKGKQLRPPATDVAFDLGVLKNGPLESWYKFSIEGRHVGYEHERITLLADGKVEVRSEVGFRSKQFGDQHFVVTTVASYKGRQLTLVESRHVAPLAPGGYECVVKPKGDAQTEATIKSEGKTSSRTYAAPADLQADYLVSQFASFMPMKAGACFHYTVMSLTGEAMDPSGMYVEDAVEIDVAGRKRRVVPVVLYQWGEKHRTAWVDPATRQIVKFDFGGNTEAVLATREEAVAGVEKSLLPASAK